jgi:hypothetical protein
MNAKSVTMFLGMTLGVLVNSASAEKYYCQHDTAVTEGRLRSAIVRAYKNAGYRTATVQLSRSSRVSLRFSAYTGVSPVPNLSDVFAVGTSGELVTDATKLQSQISSSRCVSDAQLQLNVTAIKGTNVVKHTNTVGVKLEGKVRTCPTGIARPGC